MAIELRDGMRLRSGHGLRVLRYFDGGWCVLDETGGPRVHGDPAHRERFIREALADGFYQVVTGEHAGQESSVSGKQGSTPVPYDGMRVKFIHSDGEFGGYRTITGEPGRWVAHDDNGDLMSANSEDLLADGRYLPVYGSPAPECNEAEKMPPTTVIAPGEWLNCLTSAERKEVAMSRGLFAYFPDALALIARHSVRSNEKHNLGQPVHWARGKSSDHEDCIARHSISVAVDPNSLDGDAPHILCRAWRSLAALQLWIEDKKEEGEHI